MKLTVYKYGDTLLPEKMAFKEYREGVKLPISLLFFLIETKNRKILVDVGCDTMPGFELLKHKCPVDVLEESGINRKDITDVVITHAHHDHIDSLRYYENATVYIHLEELEKAEKYLPESVQVIAISGDTEIEENVVIKPICGHSRGSCIVKIDGNVVLCGDECYMQENLTKNIPTASSFNKENSRKFTEEYRKDFYNTILFHDPNLVENIGSKVLYEREDI